MNRAADRRARGSCVFLFPRRPQSDEQLPAEECGGQNSDDRPRQVAENCSNLLNTVAENMAQPDEEEGSKRFAQNVPHGESKPGVVGCAAREVDPRPQGSNQPAAEEDSRAAPALRLRI